MPCKDGILADLLWKCGLIAVGALALLIILSRCKCYERTRCLQRWFFKGVVMYGQLDMRAKFKQYATQASNPRLALARPQAGLPLTRASLALDSPTLPPSRRAAAAAVRSSSCMAPRSMAYHTHLPPAVSAATARAVAAPRA